MKVSTLISAAAVLLASQSSFAADDHKGHDHDNKGSAHVHEAKSQRGGVVTVVNDVNYELVARADSMTLYVSDHGKPVDLAGSSAKLTLLSGSKKEEATLAPEGEALQAKGAFTATAGTKAVAQVALAGRPAQSVRFVLK